MKAGIGIAAALLIVAVLPGWVFAQQRPKRVTSNDTTRITGINLRPNGKVQITFRGGKYIQPPAMKEQPACEQLQVNENGQAADWLVAYGNYGASYPIPTSLIVYRPGKTIRNFGNGLMLIDWTFVDDGKHVELSSTFRTTDGRAQELQPKNKGKRSYQPMLTFIAETREYVWGESRNGDRSAWICSCRPASMSFGVM
jgi:hypothetical protein